MIKAMSKEKMIPITIVGERGLIFEIDHISALRDLGITGVLSGTLPMASQQNVFLGVPLQLLREEVIWLVDEKLGYLVPSETFYKSIRSTLTEESLEELSEKKSEDLQRQRDEKEAELEAKMAQLKIERKTHKGTNSSMSYFFEIPNTSVETIPTYKSFQEYYDKLHLQASLLDEFCKMTTYNPKDALNYSVYRHLKAQNYYIAPGMRFGGRFIAYPGDPLLYHSHLIVNSRDFKNEDIGLKDIVNGGRLATGVKKVWAIAGESEDGIKCFSIEWSGFG